VLTLKALFTTALPLALKFLANDQRVRKGAIAAVGVLALLGAFLAGREAKEDEWDRSIAEENIARLERELKNEREMAILAEAQNRLREAMQAERDRKVQDYAEAHPDGRDAGRAATADDVRRLCEISPC